MSLEGKVAFITGGATGIGFGIAGVLAAKGVRLALAQRSLQDAESAVRAVPGAEAIVVELDIRDPRAVDRAVNDCARRLGGLDILVNNASVTGRAALASFTDCSPDHVDLIVDTNLKGTVYCSQAAARWMIAHKRRGSIVHVSSVGAFAAQELAAVYCATKAAQVSLAQSMALELAPYGIRVNSVAPGDIATETSADAVADLQRAGSSNRFLRVTPLGRRGLPEEVGDAVAYLVSDEASFITGETLRVDGGYLAY